jgi:hypothetical protein
MELTMFYGVEFAELQHGVLATLTGLWIADPFIDLYAQNPGYWEKLAVWCPAPVAGAVFLGVGLYQMWSVLTDQMMHRRYASLAAVMVWLFMGLLLVERFFTTIQVPLYFLFAFQNAVGYVRLRTPVVWESGVRHGNSAG